MDKETAIPYYFRVAETLRKRVESNSYRPGDIIPSETKLAKEFNVSNITIRKALELLVKENYVYRKRGIGTRVLERKRDRLAIKLTGDFTDWFESAVGKISKLDVNILGLEVIECPEEIKNIFCLPSKKKIWCIKRIRSFKGEPVSYYVSYTLPSLINDLKASMLMKKGFFELLEEYADSSISKVEQTVEACCADMELSSLLNIRFGDPLFFGENVYYDKNGSPIGVTKMHCRGDRYIYKSTIWRTDMDVNNLTSEHKLTI